MGVQNVVEGEHVFLLIHDTTLDATQLLHVSTAAHNQAHVDTESPNVGSGFAGNGEDAKLAVVVELVDRDAIDGANAELPLDGRDDGRALEDGSVELLARLLKHISTTSHLVVEADDADVNLLRALLRFHKACAFVNGHNQAAGDLRIESTAVTGFFDSGIKSVRKM